MKRTAQIPLFDLAPDTTAADDAALAAIHAEARGIATQLPDGVRFGTSSWSFPGWKGLVYPPSLREDVVALSDRALTQGRKVWVLAAATARYHAPAVRRETRRRAK